MPSWYTATRAPDTAHLGLPCEQIEVDVLDRGNRPEEMLRHNPAGRVPLLHIKDGPLEQKQPKVAVGQGKVDVAAVIAAADPAFRAACRLAFGLAPLLVASAVIVLVTHPALASLLIPDVLIPDHCHGAACGSHVPAVRGGSWAIGALAAFGGLTLLVYTSRTLVSGRKVTQPVGLG